MLFSVAQTFYAAGIADEVLVARRSSVDVARATLDNARTRKDAGTVTKVDVDRAELALVRAEQQEREAITGRDQTYRALATLIQADGPFHVVDPAARRRRTGSTISRWTWRCTCGPSSGPSRRPRARRTAQRRAYFWRWAPVAVGVRATRAGSTTSTSRSTTTPGRSGLQLDWVIYDGGTRDAQRHLAAAQAEEALARTEVLRDSINDDLVNGSRSLETKQKAVETAERSVALARETLDLVRTQYEAGSVTQVDLLQAQDSLVAVQESLAQAHYDVAIADLTLRRAVGTFPGK